MTNQVKTKLLLHTCCGPCFLGVWEDLSTVQGISVTNYYYNPNIQPDDEYYKRLENLRFAAKGKTKLVIEDEYIPQEHLNAIKGLENEFPQRCLECYRIRLEKTAKFAKENNYDFFSTTLLVSPYQDHDSLKNLGHKVGVQYGVDFYYVDWRPYFREGQNTAKQMDIYRQKYCGCVYSLNESKPK
jgi:predicted adenine nucleotide alpha hydrolase (AANH) superfamily ATPase